MNKKGSLIITMLALLFLWASVLQAQEKTFIVVIDAGHGGKDPGAKGAHINEKAINLAVALKLGNLITADHHDVNVIYTRKTDHFVELSERANIANRNKADLFISIHANSLKKGCQKIKGTETYTLGLAKSEENLNVAMLENSVILLEDNYQQQYAGFDPNSSESYIIFEFLQNKHMEQSITFASEIQKSFSSAKRTNRGVRQAGFLVLKATTMPAVLIELGFICNQDEERYLRSTEGQNQLARAIYKAFVKYKNEHSRKPGIYSQRPETPQTKPPSESSDAKPPGTASGSAKAAKGEIVYKIQILSSDKKLPANSPLLKGYKADYYKDGRLYKYTCGESTKQSAIQEQLKKVSGDFKDAFIIRTQDGQRLK
jgi:N-acetylmuramoyl-L-alanine amidase